MHPAFSVIFFTTMSGIGYGLGFILCLGLTDASSTNTKIAWFVALTTISLGLLSSTLHLGNPQRAWRAFSQWRSSWLSREGCMAVLTFVPLCTLSALSIFDDRSLWVVGLVGALFCAITVYCTAMIYASLQSVVTWHTPLTPLCYLAFSLSSGLLLYGALFSDELFNASRWSTVLSIAALFVAWFVKYLWARRNMFAEYGGSTMETATGLGHLGKVRLLERPHMMGNYLTNEMGFRIARKHNQVLWKIAVLFGLVAPVILLSLSLVTLEGQAYFIVAAASSHILGLFVERWLFFASARHAVALYYGGEETLVPQD